jgi:anti-sigma factor RsiW
MGESDVRQMMSCRELVELVTDYIEGRLDGEQLDRFEAHLTECPSCVDYIEQFRQTIDALGHIPPESLSPEVEEELLAAFRDWRGGRADQAGGP